MCLSVWVLDGHPLYALLLASNRDELLARPTDPAHYWRDDPRVLAGRDLQCGGTWLGASTGGRVAFLSNCWAVRNRADAVSRGALISDFLQGAWRADGTEGAGGAEGEEGAEGAGGPREYLESVARRAHLFNGFNLVAADVAFDESRHSADAAAVEEQDQERKQGRASTEGGGAEGACGEEASSSPSAHVRMYYLTNAPPHEGGSASRGADGGGKERDGAAACGVMRVERGLHGLSNAALDTPWSKVERAKEHLAELLAESKGGEVPAEVIIERVLMDAWQPVHPHTSADVAEAEHCPMGPEYDQRLTPVFVNCDTPKGAYGTRSCIVVAVHRSGLVEFTEKSRRSEHRAVSRGHGSNPHRNIGFVTFDDAASVDKVLEEPRELDGATLAIDRATPKDEGPRGGGGGGYRGSPARPFRAYPPGAMALPMSPFDFMPPMAAFASAYPAYPPAMLYGAPREPAYTAAPPPPQGHGGAGGQGYGGGGGGRAVHPTKIFVGKLPHDATVGDIREYFGRFGPVEDVYLPKDSAKGGHRGFCFVTFLEEEVAAFVAKRQHEICGRTVAVERATPQEGAPPPAPSSAAYLPSAYAPAPSDPSLGPSSGPRSPGAAAAAAAAQGYYMAAAQQAYGQAPAPGAEYGQAA
ncbi:unnamed protein product, partial [Closterium sp. NIES-65]